MVLPINDDQAAYDPNISACQNDAITAANPYVIDPLL